MIDRKKIDDILFDIMAMANGKDESGFTIEIEGGADIHDIGSFLHKLEKIHSCMDCLYRKLDNIQDTSSISFEINGSSRGHFIVKVEKKRGGEVGE